MQSLRLCSIFVGTTIAAAAFLVSCSDDTPVSSGSSDRTAPRIVDLVPVDAYHIDVTFDEELDRTSAETNTNYQIDVTATSATASAAGGSVYVTTAVLGADRRTVSLATSKYNSMAGLQLRLSVEGVADVHGNATTAMGKSFAGSDQPDDDAPVIVSTTPAAGATAVPIGTSVTIRFNEPVDNNEYGRNITWTSSTGPVDYYVYPSDYSSIIMITRERLDYNAWQTIRISGVSDGSDNIMPDVELSFHTATVVDTTPPKLVSSYPADKSVNVSVRTKIVLTFSEPIDPYDYHLDMVPDVLWTSRTWSNDGKSVTYILREDIDLDDNQEYLVQIYPNGVFDLGGNTTNEFQTVIFTTGARLEQGQISGRIIGDPGTGAADPTGALVVAESWETYNVTTVLPNDTYTVRYLQWGPYDIFSYQDTNHDGLLNVYGGDALGAYGVDFDAEDYERDTVGLGQGTYLSDIDFHIYDPSGVSGVVEYSGQPIPDYRNIGVGLFATVDDATNLAEPVATTSGTWPWSPDWLMNTLLQDVDDGTYYLAAYIDADSTLSYTPGSDPTGIYGGFAHPTPLQLVNGADYYDVVIPILDPVATRTSPAASRVSWPAPKRNPVLEHAAEVLHKSRVTTTSPAPSATSAHPRRD